MERLGLALGTGSYIQILILNIVVSVNRFVPLYRPRTSLLRATSHQTSSDKDRGFLCPLHPSRRGRHVPTIKPLELLKLLYLRASNHFKTCVGLDDLAHSLLKGKCSTCQYPA